MNKTSFESLVSIMARLRSPDGCPWDREQTHESLLKYLKEETAEMIQAVRNKDWDNLQEELGDVLLQVLFHAELARERGDFDINDVLATLGSKLVGRHPHVFRKRETHKNWTAQDVVTRWNELKKIEKEKRTKRTKLKSPKSGVRPRPKRP